MKHTIGRLFFLFAALCLFTPSAHAQDIESPMIYVRDFHISTTTLIAGAVVPGSATLVNEGNADVPDVSYIASIVGNYEGADPTAVYDSETLGKVYMPAHSEKKITFAYKVPIYLNGNGYGMELTAGLSSGHLLGWGSSRVTIKGLDSRHTMNVEGTLFQVGSESFTPRMGPTIHKGETATIQAIVINTSKEAFKVYPQLTVFERTLDGAKVYSSSTPPTILTLNNDKTLIQAMPELEKPGVYAFTFAFYDSAGNQVGRTVEGQFIIGGYIATIQSVSVTNQTVFKSGDVAQIQLFYSGTPADIIRPIAFRGAKGDMTVKLFNQNDDLVSEIKKEVALDAESTVMNFSMPIKKGAHALRTEITVEKDGKVIGTYKANLSENYDSMRGTSEMSFSKIGFALIFVIVIALVGLLIRFRKMSKRGGVAVLILLSGFLGASAIVSAGSFTGTTYSDATHTLQGPSIVVNTPAEGATLTPGKAVGIEFRVTAGECNNLPADLYASVVYNGVQQNFATSREKLKDCHKYNTCQMVDLVIHKTLTGYRNPAAAGSYNIAVYTATNWYYTPKYTGTSVRNVTVQVVDSCPNIAGTQAGVPTGKHLDPVTKFCIDNCPAGQHNDTAAPYSCIPDVDVCPNIAGNQNVPPPGRVKDYDPGSPSYNKCIVECLPDSGTHYDNATDKCIPNSTDLCPNITGVQTTIPSGKFLDGATGWCIAVCPAGQHNDSVTQLCVTDCAAGQHWDAGLAMCVNDGCPAGTHWDETAQLCLNDDCPAQQHRDAADICIWDNCPVGQTRDPVTNICKGDCPAGTTWNAARSQCLPDTCPAGQHKNPTTLLCEDDTSCPAGQHLDQVASSPTFGTCINNSCPVDTHWDEARGFCVPDIHFCPAGTHWDTVTSSCIPDVVCVPGGACTPTTANKCGNFKGKQVCTSTGTLCVPDDSETCTVCSGQDTLCRGVCVKSAACPPEVTCTTPTGKILKEGESIILYDIKKGISAANNCAQHQEKRTCILDYRDPFKGVIVVNPGGTPGPSGAPGGGGGLTYRSFASATTTTGVLSGKPNPYDDPHVYGRCAPYFKEV